MSTVELAQEAARLIKLNKKLLKGCEQTVNKLAAMLGVHVVAVPPHRGR